MSERFSMVGQHALGKVTRDAIFTAGAAADQAAAKVGRDRVVNATIGLILDDHEQTAILPSVDDALRRLRASDFAAYSPFLGTPEFREAVKTMTFGPFLPDAFVEAVATPGSTGALRNAFWNYLDVGGTVLVPDWRWSPYDTIASEHLRSVLPYRLFNKDLEFSLEGLEQALTQVLATQDRAIVVVNDPAHNPTGYDLTQDQWEALMALLRDKVREGSKRLVLFLDAPYIDFAEAGVNARRLFQTFTPIPKNLLLTVGYSISKSLTLYGMRTGAIVGISQDRGVMDEFLEVNGSSARGVWTNVPRAGMQLVSLLHRDSLLSDKVVQEREVLRRMMFYRASVFREEAADVGLRYMPFRSGFFISVPTHDPVGLAQRLAARNIFVVPLPQGIRIAISGIPARKISGIAPAVAECLDALQSAA